MKKLLIPFIILLLVGLQNSIFEYVRILNVKPDIALTFVICYTLIRGNPAGTAAGIFLGVTEDIFFSGVFGINSIACMLTVYFIGSIEGKIYKGNIFVPAIFTFIATLIKEMFVFLFLYLTRANMNIVIVLTSIIIPEAIYNTILAAILFRLVAKFNNRFLLNKSGGFNT